MEYVLCQIAFGCTLLHFTSAGKKHCLISIAKVNIPANPSSGDSWYRSSTWSPRPWMNCTLVL